MLTRSDFLQVNYQTLRVYITDQCFSVERKTSTQIMTKIVNEGDVWYVEVRDLLKKLQNSPVAVEGLVHFLLIFKFLMIRTTGIVKMSCPDPYDSAYSLCFLRMTREVILEATPAHPLYLPLSGDYALRLTIDHLGRKGHFLSVLSVLSDRKEWVASANPSVRGERTLSFHMIHSVRLSREKALANMPDSKEMELWLKLAILS
jgi:hypothetical protein